MSQSDLRMGYEKLVWLNNAVADKVVSYKLRPFLSLEKEDKTSTAPKVLDQKIKLSKKVVIRHTKSKQIAYFGG